MIFIRLEELLNQAKNPPCAYRPVPFWSFNDELKPDELSWQVQQHKDAGLGGYFMHARSGLRTKYMSQEWMHALDVCIEEGQRLGIRSWLYDENGWPSGFADGVVPQKGEYYMQKSLRHEIVAAKDVKPDRFTLGLFEIGVEGKKITDLSVVSPDQQILHIRYVLNPYYSDLLSPDVVREFIVSTYDVYYERFGQYFGKEIPGIFTDEPQYGRYALPWSNQLEERFCQKYGYSLIENLNALYVDIAGYQKVRHDYHRLLAELFADGFSAQISQWCEEHGVVLTGHLLFEEDCAFQCTCAGSDMLFYEPMQLPAIDWLGNHIGNPIVQKQVSSVADQLQKKQVMCEMYGGGTWSMSPQDIKWITEFNLVNGVNLICTHLEGYSLRGMRKRDWPPSIYYHQPWWSQMPQFNDYLSRICMLLTEGETYADILVVHPLHSVWMEFEHSCYANHTNPRCHFIDSNFEWVCNTLSMNQFDYHLGDEHLMAKYGSVENGKLKVGCRTYEAVLVPPAYTLDEPVFNLLMRYADEGGKLFCFESFPTCIDGREDTRAEKLREKCVCIAQNEQELVRHLSAAVPKMLTLDRCNVDREYRSIHHLIKTYEDGYLVYLFNTDKAHRKRAYVDFNLEGYSLVGCYQAEQGNFEAIETLQYRLDLPAAGSCLLVYKKLEMKTEPAKTVDVSIVVPCKYDHAEPMGANALMLDYCRVTSQAIPEISRQHFLEVQKQLLLYGRDIDICVEYTFFSAADGIHEKETYLLVETPDVYDRITLNGEPISQNPCGWMLDKNFILLDIRGKIRRGENVVKLYGTFRNNPEILRKYLASDEHEEERNTLSYDSEIEAIYVVGDFAVVPKTGDYEPGAKNTAVAQDFVIVMPEDVRPHVDNFTTSGYPFYRGAFSVMMSVNLPAFQKAVLQIPKPYAHMVAVSVNGVSVSSLMWDEFSLDITHAAKPGDNEICLELYSSNRNFLGHHHHPDRDLELLAPTLFDKSNGFTDEYAFVRYGMNGMPTVIVSVKEV